MPNGNLSVAKRKSNGTNEKVDKVDIPPPNPKKPHPSRKVVFVDPDDIRSPWWWPALIVPKAELKLFRSTVDGEMEEPGAGQVLVCYFEDGSFSIVPEADTIPFCPYRPPYITYLLGPNFKSFKQDKAIVLATLYWETGIVPPSFAWLKNQPPEDRYSLETFPLKEMLDEMKWRSLTLLKEIQHFERKTLGLDNFDDENKNYIETENMDETEIDASMIDVEGGLSNETPSSKNMEMNEPRLGNEVEMDINVEDSPKIAAQVNQQTYSKVEDIKSEKDMSNEGEKITVEEVISTKREDILIQEKIIPEVNNPLTMNKDIAIEGVDIILLEEDMNSTREDILIEKNMATKEEHMDTKVETIPHSKDTVVKSEMAGTKLYDSIVLVDEESTMQTNTSQPISTAFANLSSLPFLSESVIEDPSISISPIPRVIDSNPINFPPIDITDPCHPSV